MMSYHQRARSDSSAGPLRCICRTVCICVRQESDAFGAAAVFRAGEAPWTEGCVKRSEEEACLTPSEPTLTTRAQSLGWMQDCLAARNALMPQGTFHHVLRAYHAGNVALTCMCSFNHPFCLSYFFNPPPHVQTFCIFTI